MSFDSFFSFFFSKKCFVHLDYLFFLEFFKFFETYTPLNIFIPKIIP